MDELEEIKARYARRGDASSIYGMHRNDAFWSIQRRDELMRDMLVSLRPDGFENLRVLEVGCGTGVNLLRFLMWGVAPEGLHGVDLLPERVQAARHALPRAATVVEGDASAITFDRPFDVVLQSTTLSSILDDRLRREVARAMWDEVAPGGAVLSYDFAVNNPRNADVRKVTFDELRSLFPEAEARQRRLTLAPPIGRRVASSRVVYRALSRIPLLLSHRLVLLRKAA